MSLLIKMLILAVALSAINILLSFRGAEDNSNVDDLKPESRSLRILEDNKALETSSSEGTEENIPPAKSDVEDDNGSSLRSEPTYNEILDELDILSGGASAKDLECPHPLVPFQNIILKRNTTTTTDDQDLLIPKVLHVSMNSRCLPRDLVARIERWHKVLPNYSIFFHDDEAVSRMFEHDWSEFTDLHKAMKCVIHKGAMKIDVWRILLLYKYGGVYTDIDNWPVDAFNETTIRSDLSGFFLNDGFNRPSQWFMAVEPRHIIMYLTMTHIIKNILDIPNLRTIATVKTTGPSALGQGYKNFLKDASNWKESGVVHTGLFGKKVLKNRHSLVLGKYGYDEIVPYNSTLNVTVEERIQLESGVLHWSRKQHKSKKAVYPMPCRAYIDRLDKGTIDVINL